MNRPSLLLLAMALALPAALPLNAAPTSASEQLLLMDKTTASGAMRVAVTTYGPASPKTGLRGAGKRVEATLLFERPDRFKLVLDPGGKNERRIVGDGDVVRWFDLATGLEGKAATRDVVDPTLVALLGTVAELGTYAPAKDLPQAKGSPVVAARMLPASYGVHAVSATAWLHAGQPAGFLFELVDDSRVFVAVLAYKANVALKPSDFAL